MKILILNIIFFLLFHCTAVEIATHEIKTIEKKSNTKKNIFELTIEDPYQVNNIWFYPQKYDIYNRIGMVLLLKVIIFFITITFSH